MRIAYFTSSYPRATDTFIRREVAGLRKLGIDVRTFAVRRSSAEHDVDQDILEEKRRTRYLLPAGPLLLLLRNLSALARAPGRYFSAVALAAGTAAPGLRARIFQFIYFQEGVLLAAELEKQGITHLHNHLGDSSGTIAMLAGRLSGIPYSITVHGPHLFFEPTRWALREKLRHSAFIVCISQFCRSQMMLYSDYRDWDRLQIVHCGVDVDRARRVVVSPAATRLLYVGRLAAEKGLTVLLRSLRMLADRGLTLDVTLIGDGEDRRALEDLAQRLGLSERVEFAGYLSQEQIKIRLQHSDLFVLPSFAEGVPVSLMEAMAAGVPVLATFVGGVVELVEPEKTGLVVSPGDALALSNAIGRYLEDPQLRARLAAAAIEKVASEFNLDTEIAALAGVFRQSQALPAPGPTPRGSP
jgi:colanic acid/amylovoran biosynthesis glycosyltransferase